MRPTRWELLLDQKPIPIIEHLLEEVARLFAADLARWPPQVTDFDAQTGVALERLLAEHPLRPDDRVYAEAFRLTRWDLARDFEAVDDYWRNQRHLEAGLTARDKPMILFLTRYVSEQLLALGEATQGRVNRARMLDALGRTERHFQRKASLP
ncbi:MAG: hypothetical protein MUC96_27255 [Myxococcaceae bacterium]|nr:hypothetical protein [Myxococcaceae bacterium]